MDLVGFAFNIIALLIALTIHEASHALIAFKMGDPTAKHMGRLSLNPLAHLDPMGTMMIIFTSLVGFGIGWAKPVPVNPYNLNRGAKAGMAWVSLAGPASNFAMATLFAFVLKNQVIPSSLETLVLYIVMINIAIGFFNLIPIPPLDGFKVLLGLLPDRQSYSLLRYEAQGPAILLLVIFGDAYLHLGILSHLIWQPAQLLFKMLVG